MFIFNGISSDDINGAKIKVISLPSIAKSKEKISNIAVDGRDGDLTEITGYDAETKTIKGDYFGKNIDFLYSWLDGEGELILSNQMDRFYEVRILSVELEEYLKNRYEITIKYKQQPFGYLLLGKEAIEITKTTAIYNPGNHPSKPYIKVYGSGDITLNLNNTNVVLKDVSNFIEIDSKRGNCYVTDSNGVITDTNDKMYSPFPVLEKGTTNISWTGNVSKIEIIPRWCCK